jgi:hypothetical protein
MKIDMKIEIRYLQAAFILVLGCIAPLTVFAEIPDDATKPSLFFTADELDQIYQANDGIIAAPDGNDATGKANVAINAGPRVLKLAGILYHGDKDWVVWLNNERITPKNIPDRILGIIVKRDRIALKWLDRGTNRIINLVLLPHQEYHIDTDTVTLGTER